MSRKKGQMSVTLRPITSENWEQCLRLAVKPEQTHFVASNAYSLVQAAYNGNCMPLAIYGGDLMVGFTMSWHVPGERRYHISRLMVDARFQGKGYGRAALEQVLARLVAQPDCDKIDITYEPHNEVARRLYTSVGFRETGEMEDGEVLALFSVGHRRSGNGA
jgi:diamine N-acetyltransferase